MFNLGETTTAENKCHEINNILQKLRRTHIEKANKSDLFLFHDNPRSLNRIIYDANVECVTALRNPFLKHQVHRNIRQPESFVLTDYF